MNKSVRIIIVGLLAAVTGGCATVSTLNQPIKKGSPLVMSGTRLDLASIRGEAHIQQRFGVAAPRYPLIDLPASASMDVLVFGFTLPVAMFRVAINHLE